MKPARLLDIEDHITLIRSAKTDEVCLLGGDFGLDSIEDEVDAKRRVVRTSHPSSPCPSVEESRRSFQIAPPCGSLKAEI